MLYPIVLVLLRQKIASSGVTVRSTLKRVVFEGTGHERGPAGTGRGLCQCACRGAWACRSGGGLAGSLPGPAAARRTQERRADRGGNGAGPGLGQAPIAAAFRCQRALVERAGSQPDPGADPADHRRQRCDRSLDHRRYRLSEERTPLGRGGASVLWPARQAGQLPSRGQPRPAPGQALSLANHAASLPVAWRLYLPLEWTAGASRRAAAGIPETIGFLTKPEIALEQIRVAYAAGLPRGVVLMDAGYGTNTRLREEIGALGLTYVAGIPPQTSVWPPGTAPLPPLPWSGRGRRPKLMRRNAEHRPVSVKALALDLPAASWQTVSWREGSAGALTSRFVRVRVRAAHRDEWRGEPREEEWLLIEWPEGDAEPAKYWLATLPPDMLFGRLVDLAKLRWRIERDYQELKQELGVGSVMPATLSRCSGSRRAWRSSATPGPP